MLAEIRFATAAFQCCMVQYYHERLKFDSRRPFMLVLICPYKGHCGMLSFEVDDSD